MDPFAPGAAAAGPDALVVIPTYNEAENIAAVLGHVLALPDGPAVLVVDDASPDGTAARVRALQAEAPAGRIRLAERAVAQTEQPSSTRCQQVPLLIDEHLVISALRHCEAGEW